GMPLTMPAARPVVPRSTYGQRSSAEATSQAARNRSSAVAMTEPLKTLSPTAAEWSGEKVIMSAAIAANAARARCTWRTVNVAGADMVILYRGLPPVYAGCVMLRPAFDRPAHHHDTGARYGRQPASDNEWRRFGGQRSGS